MTIAMPHRSSAWWADDIRPEQVVQIIEAAFPQVRTVYFGNATGRWWALCGRPDVDEKWIEADTAQKLYEAIVGGVPCPSRQAERPAAQPAVGRTPTARTAGRAMPQRPAPGPMHAVPRIDGAPVALHIAQLLLPPPSRMRRFLDGCRHFFLGGEGDDW